MDSFHLLPGKELGTGEITMHLQVSVQVLILILTRFHNWT